MFIGFILDVIDAFDLNVWSGRAVQQVLVGTLADAVSASMYSGVLGLEHVLRTIIDIGRRYFERSTCLISFLERYFIRRPTVGAVRGFGWPATHVSMTSNLLLKTAEVWRDSPARSLQAGDSRPRNVAGVLEAIVRASAMPTPTNATALRACHQDQSSEFPAA